MFAKRKSASDFKGHGGALALASIAIAFGLVAMGSVSPLMGDTSPLNNVQVFVSTATPLQYQYYFSAYNLSGSLVSSTQTSYPGAGFELPSGEYLITVSAVYQSNYFCGACMKPGSLPSSSTGSSSSTGGASMPIAYYGQASEYGYQMIQVSGPQTFTISTTNETSFPTTHVTVTVHYVNGTAAANTSVSASIIGGWYYWGPNSTLSMYGQTDASGTATLVLPSAPAVISAWDWIPVNLTQGQKSAMVNIGGEVVNVTAYWNPTYVGLAASGVVLPPTSSIQLTLHYQKPNFWAVPVDATVAPTPGVGLSDKNTGVPVQAKTGSSSQFYIPSSIPSIRSGSGSEQAAVTNPLLGWGTAAVEATLLGAGGALLAGLALALFLKRRTLG